MPKLEDDDIERALAVLPGWAYDGRSIAKEYEFGSFPEAVAFVGRLVEPAETANHHPDLAISYRRVRVSLRTHSEDAVTQRDLDLAHAVEQVAAV